MVTETTEPRCGWCGRKLDVRKGPGRPRKYCKQSCRQADYVARQRASEVGLSESELIVTREALEELRDLIYVLEAAVEDAETDLGEAQEVGDVRRILSDVLVAARPVIAGYNTGKLANST